MKDEILVLYFILYTLYFIIHTFMKVLFIHAGSENLGIEQLSAWVKHHGHETQLLFDPATFTGLENANFPPLAHFLDRADSLVDAAVGSEADVIAFSAATVNYRWALDIAARIKKRFSRPVIFGGVHATAVPERVLKNPQVDAVVVGEGEGAIIDILNGMKDGRLPDKPIPNVWRRTDNGIAGEPPRPYIRDLDRLPFPDKDLFFNKVPAFSRFYMIMTSRGCPYRCAFCCNSLYHDLYSGERGHVRRRSPDNVIEELKWAIDRYRPSFISFWDDVFTADKKWLRRFGELYHAIGLPYDIYTHPLAVDEECSRILADTGCYRVKIGLQTVSDATRGAYLDRGGSAEQVAHVVKLLKGCGITVGIDHMLGLPGEGKAEQEAAALYYSKIRPDRINSYWMLYFPGARIVESARQNGTLTDGDIEAIEEGKGETSYMYLKARAEDHRKALAPYQTFFDLLPILPDSWALWLIHRGLAGKMPYHPIIRQAIVSIAAIFQGDKRYRNTLKVMLSRKRVP